MPIFSRRRLKSMIDDLAPDLGEVKTRDIIRRLEHRDTGPALAAEAELSFLWALSGAVHAEIEPKIPGTPRRLEAISHDLFPSTHAVIEVRAISDDTFSDGEGMNRTAEKILHFANLVRKKSGKRLRFEFMERSFYDEDGFHRIRCVDPNFSMTPGIEARLESWFKSAKWPDPKQIRVTEGLTDIVITCHANPVHPQNRVFSSMPPVAYHAEENPVFRALKKKADSFAGIDKSMLRCVILFDVGCALLRNLRSFGGVQEIGGDKIIRHAIQKFNIDLVCVFSPTYDQPIQVLGSWADRKKIWNVNYFDGRGEKPTDEYKNLEKVASMLPRPAYEGYQVRSLHRQGAFKAGETFGILPTKMEWGNGPMTIKVSAKLVHECLAGKISAEEFQREAFNKDKNHFMSALERGNTIRSAEFESGGLDKDDDYLVFELDFDWGRVKLDAPKGD